MIGFIVMIGCITAAFAILWFLNVHIPLFVMAATFFLAIALYYTARKRGGNKPQWPRGSFKPQSA